MFKSDLHKIMYYSQKTCFTNLSKLVLNVISIFKKSTQIITDSLGSEMDIKKLLVLM